MTGRTFLDAGGAAPLHPRAREAYDAALVDGWADPARLHAEGRRARQLLEAARASLAGSLGVVPGEVRLTPSHTAALHAAVAHVARARRRTGHRVVLSAVERAAVHAAARHASDDVVVVPVDRHGRVDAAAWRDAVRPDVALAALQHANGEVGTVQPVAAAAQVCRDAGVPLLVDAGASVGHAAVPDAWDLLAVDPADWGAGPGVGVLAVRARVRTTATGPEDADPWAPGGVSVPAVLAAAASLEAVLAEREAADARRREMVATVRREVARVADVEVVGDPDNRLPHVVTFSALYADGEALLHELDRRGFAVGSGSACTSLSLEPSHVLAAMGALTHGNVRVVLPATATWDEVHRFCEVVPEALAAVRRAAGATDL